LKQRASLLPRRSTAWEQLIAIITLTNEAADERSPARDSKLPGVSTVTDACEKVNLFELRELLEQLKMTRVSWLKSVRYRASLADFVTL
jgi:hypothetical protein